MKNFALEKPRHGLQTDVRMWRDIHGLAGTECQRPETVEETPRPDEASILDWKRSRNRQRAQMELTIWIRSNACVGRAERHARFGGDWLGPSRHYARIMRRAPRSKLSPKCLTRTRSIASPAVAVC